MSKSRKRVVLVTGASGFIGRHLAQALASKGFSVLAQYRSSRPAKNLHSGVRWWRGDLRGAVRCPVPVDYLIHAAATSPDPTARGSDADPNMFAGNVKAAWGALQIAIEHRIPHRVLLSSFSAEKTSFDLKNRRTSGVFYGLSKLLGEILFAKLHPPRGSTLVVRLPAVVGAGAARNWPVQVVERIRSGQPVRVFSPNSAFNSVVGVEELVSWLGDWLRKPLQGYHLCGLGSSYPVTILQAVRILQAASRKKVRLKVFPSKKKAGGLRSLRKAKELGFCPTSTSHTLTRYAKQAFS